MSKRKCSICSHADVIAINAALEAGVQQTVISSQFCASKYSLSRHAHKCLKPAPSNGESITDQTEKWLRRADDVFLKASVDGDTRGQAQAIGSAIKHLQLATKQAAQKAQQDRALPANTNEWTENEKQKFRDYTDGIIEEHAWLAQTEPEQIMELFQASLDDPGQAAQSQLKRELQIYAKCWLRVRSGIRPNDETWRLLHLHFDELAKKHDVLEQVTA
jgi:hypothetical protein